MAIYHLSTKAISRSAGRSAVASAAYWAGCCLTDERTGQLHDYTRKGGVVFSELVLPDGGTAERATLWNAAERAESRRDSRVAREWTLALPSELGTQEHAWLARAFAKELVKRYGVAVDMSVHAPNREGDPRNHHAHLLVTTRQVSRTPEGAIVLGEKVAIELADKDRKKAGIVGRAAHDIEQLRARLAELANRALERAGREERIDHRSLKAQGIDREATTHLGPIATAMERRGKASDRGDIDRMIRMDNAERAQLSAQIIDLSAEREQRAAARLELNVQRFEDLALRRNIKAHGFHDLGSAWQAMPEPLRKMIDSFNEMPKERQEALLPTLREPAVQKALGEMFREFDCAHDRGRSR